MADHALSLADTVVINAVGALISDRIFDADRQNLHFGVLSEAVNAANWGNPKVGPLIYASRKLIDLHPDPKEPLRAQYMLECMELEAAFNDVIVWRLGEALDAWRNRKAA